MTAPAADSHAHIFGTGHPFAADLVYTPQADHVGLCPGLINEDQTRRVQRCLKPVPTCAAACNVSAILLTAQNAFF